MLWTAAAETTHNHPTRTESASCSICVVAHRWPAVRGAAVAVFAASFASAQSVGNSGSLNGTVLDQTGAVVARAKVEVRNPVSGFDRSTTTDDAGKFAFTNIPFNPYHLIVTAPGFMNYAQDVEPRSSVPRFGQAANCRLD
jgi:Carboxypeptidase regulatory-like domain